MSAERGQIIQKSVRIFAVIDMFDIQALESREKFCAKREIVLLMKKIFSLDNNFSFGADRFLYLSFHKSLPLVSANRERFFQNREMSEREPNPRFC